MKRKQLRHGLNRTQFYRKWGRIIAVCNNPTADRYAYYGGRGIKCLWNNFIEFRDDMYESYKEHVNIHGTKNTTIDRIDVNGHYCKENCKWATKKQQAMNRRSRKEITYNGITRSITEWSEITGIPKIAFWLRLNRYKWTPEKAITTPCNGKPRKNQ